ncbi:MAG: poly-gamma-glutamate hydrolase family protein [Rhodoferax sp.]|nr:poly-gamma-glutamate hydrolase family protein [Rhodoferax sp.]MCB2043358.1 poly-gamma-glutamate hydrolase family protein [Rhodoferax sp.]
MDVAHPEYPSFAALAAARDEGREYIRSCRFRAQSRVAILAPHGGRIEPHIDQIAADIASAELSLYAFRSVVPRDVAILHITSHRFDDPACIVPLSQHPYVVTVHGRRVESEHVLLGGLDTELLAELADAIRHAGFSAQTEGHRFPGRHPRNICNRGARARGAQLELSPLLRKSARRGEFVQAVRAVLLAANSR